MADRRDKFSGDRKSFFSGIFPRSSRESLTPSPALSRRRQNVIASKNCSICLDTFRDPRLLPCGHSFCASCLTPTLTDDLCPTCRQSYPHRSIGNIPSNVALASLADNVISLNITDDDNDEDDEGPFQVFVKDLNGREHAITMTPNESVIHFKTKISEALDMPFDENNLWLLFGGKQLDNKKMLSDYNIQKLSTIHMLSYMLGG